MRLGRSECGARRGNGLGRWRASWARGEAGWASVLGPCGSRKGPGWVLVVGLGLFSIFFSISIYSLISNLSQTKVEFKYEFEFKPQSIKSMHQHEFNIRSLKL